MDQSLKLLFVIKCLSLPGGGAERVLATVARGLERRGHNVTVLSQDADGAEDYYAMAVRRVRNGEEACFSRSRLIKHLAWLPKLRKALASERPDLAIGFMHSAYFPLALASIGTRTPILASEHTVFQHYLTRRVERSLLYLVPYLVSGITVVSRQARESFPSRLKRKMIVVPNVVDQPSVHHEPNCDKSRYLLISVGRLDAAKDHKTLIQAFAEISQRWPEWDLEIAGEGECRPHLESQIAALGLSDRVRLLGAVADIDSLLARADVFAMASRYESFGLATAEALSRSIPAVGFADCLGTNELIQHYHNGLLIDPRESRSSALAEGLEVLFADADLRKRLGSNGPPSMSEFREEAVLDAWEAALRMAGAT